MEDFIESTYCANVSHPHLMVGFGLSSRIPMLINQCCVMNNCTDCGVEKKMLLSTCEILATDTNGVSVMEWVLVEQQGVNKNTGKQHTQL